MSLWDLSEPQEFIIYHITEIYGFLFYTTSETLNENSIDGEATQGKR